MQIGLLLFPNLTQLDLTGPAQVLCARAGRHAAHGLEDPRSGADRRRLLVVPTTTFADCPPLDVICVPGGGGQIELMDDDETLDFLRHQAARRAT